MLLALRNIDLPLKVRRRKRRHNVKECLKHLGRSIDERPTEITGRSEFGHWEIDTVVGSKSKSDNVILTLVERLTRKYIAIKIEGKTTSSVSKAMEYLKNYWVLLLFFSKEIFFPPLVGRGLFKDFFKGKEDPDFFAMGVICYLGKYSDTNHLTIYSRMSLTRFMQLDF